ncbi:redoxin domain-containing protein [Paenibacillus urinalis]|uniref:Redoxin domain-containing protein n=2 Tax=Paenibacillus TaxID=44249 RepID=A0AAX3MY17_9BACL|nr:MULTISPECIES: redoxin domain-containing protein [Paenibacillus]OMC68582.1 alkyl hydroperoxide reductase [Paenibacillus sp. FSL H7-0326]WDH81269.1 redoxin domain-containing protein [Paenibacillus urinalis]WDH97320.1 redoxin domain-containing protein [Paenibacillus urinalis]WDI00983.1 redoxin domain-containing protein [Paenibacillus urinalis]SDW58096.1 Peroxiredoxin [Paenibacillus sp. PDC88]
MGRSKRTVQVVILIFIVILGAYAIFSSTAKSDGKPVVGDSVPDFELLGIDEAVHKLDQFEGQPMVINFWGTWCEPCVDEMPALQEQWEKWKEQGVAFIGINVGEDKMTVNNFVRQVGVDFPIMYDEKKIATSRFAVGPMPSTFFVSKDGKISEIFEGQLNLDTLEYHIQQLVNSN